MLFSDGNMQAIDARWGGATHRMELNEKVEYRGPSFSARIDPDSFELLHVEPGARAGNGELLSLEPCAAMYLLLKGLNKSLSHFPVVAPDGQAATGWISEPKYAD